MLRPAAYGFGIKVIFAALLVAAIGGSTHMTAQHVDAALGGMHVVANPSVLPVNQGGGSGGSGSGGFVNPVVSSTTITAQMNRPGYPGGSSL